MEGGLDIVHRLGGHALALEVVGVFELDDNGKITRLRDYYDLGSLMDQIAAAFSEGA